MYLRNWEDFASVDGGGFIVQHNPNLDASGIDWESISSRLGEISATATSIPGNLDGTEDGDLIEVTLTAGQTYSFDYRGAPGASSTPIWRFSIPLSRPSWSQDDDGGLGRGSLITFTPTTTGTYYLYATSFYTVDGEDPSFDDGDYTISMWQRETDVPGSTNVLASLATAASIGLGTYFGNIDAAGDNDYYQINVVAGQFYSFTLAGGAASNPEFATPGNTAATLSLYRADGSLIASNLNFESDVGFMRPTNTTIYVRAAGLADDDRRLYAGRPADRPVDPRSARIAQLGQRRQHRHGAGGRRSDGLRLFRRRRRELRRGGGQPRLAAAPDRRR